MEAPKGMILTVVAADVAWPARPRKPTASTELILTIVLELVPNSLLNRNVLRMRCSVIRKSEVSLVGWKEQSLACLYTMFQVTAES